MSIPFEPPTEAKVHDVEKRLALRGDDTSDGDKKYDAHSSWDEHGNIVVNEKAVGSNETLDAAYIETKGLSVLHVTGLLFGEMIPLAVLSVPSTFASTGWVGGFLLVFVVGIVNLYTSLVLWRYCLKYPDQLNIADIGSKIFAFGRKGGSSRFGWWLGLLVVIVNNWFIMGFHTLTASEIINTWAYNPGKGWCTVAIAAIITAVCIVLTLPRKFAHISFMGGVSAVSMTICVILTLIFIGIQGKNPAAREAGDPPVKHSAIAPKGTPYVTGNNGAISIVFIWVGQVAYPSFIAEMKEPEKFPIALYALTIAEFALFAVTGAIIYWYSGQYSTAPAVGVIKNETLKKIAFSFAFPPTILIAIIYASVSSRAIFAGFMRDTYHYNHHTKRSWILWSAIILVSWVIAFVLASSIPSFGDIVDLTSALCDSSMGYIFWALAYIELYRGELWVGQGIVRKVETCFNFFLIPVGLYLLGPGTYSSVQAIIDAYNAGTAGAFTCKPNNI